VKEMMEDNQLDYIFNPVNVEGGKATNLMGDDPDTINITEGFPDSTTSLEQKGYTGDLYPRNGYVLYGHDKISPEDSANYTTVNYVDNVTTMYYYTCESTGVVRQWDNSIIEKASEYTDMDLTYDQLQIVLTIQIYTKPQ
jgi:hypothetical protein